VNLIVFALELAINQTAPVRLSRLLELGYGVSLRQKRLWRNTFSAMW